MSVTNGERLVTKQDLKDFYDGILPYIGGVGELGDIGDVDISSPANGNVIKYNSSSEEWVNGTLSASDVGAIASTLKGANNGVAELDATGKVPSSQLPSYVDDVLEYSSTSAFPATGETGKIYVATDTNKTYRWSGSAYVVISETLALGETDSTAYRGDRGKTAYDHSQVSSGNPHGVTKSDVGLGNVGNFKAVSTAASQGLSDTEKSNARANIGAGTGSSNLTIGTTSTTAAAGDHTHTSIKDSGNGTNTTFGYSKAELGRNDFTWVAVWNGYELRGANKSLFAKPPTIKSQSLAASATSVEFTSVTLGTNSKVDIATSQVGLDYNSISVSGSTVTVTFDAQSSAVTVYLIVTEV